VSGGWGSITFYCYLNGVIHFKHSEVTPYFPEINPGVFPDNLSEVGEEIENQRLSLRGAAAGGGRGLKRMNASGGFA
jgi:hypothetical protein